jgi:hypothetical protein
MPCDALRPSENVDVNGRASRGDNVGENRDESGIVVVAADVMMIVAPREALGKGLPTLLMARATSERFANPTAGGSY